MTEIIHRILDKKSIIKQVVIALNIGALILVSAVLPAEYGIDPLGIGEATGFSKLYVGNAGPEALASKPHKVLSMANVGSAADIPKPAAADKPAPDTQFVERNDEVNIIIPAGKGLEYKVNMLKYGSLKYEWSTDKGELYFDFHGEVKDNNNYFESYTIAYSNNIVGSFISPFEGPQGWYFQNNSNEDITVRIKLKGQYLPKQ